MANRKGFGVMAAVALVSGMVLAGCATRLGDFTVMSSKNVELSRLGEFTRSAERVEGSDSIVTILFFIPVKSHINLKEALDSALDRVPGAQALVDARLYMRRMNFILFQIQSYVISGTVLVDPKVARVTDASETSPDTPYLVMDTHDGENFSMRSVSEDEYRHLLAAVK